MNICLISTWNQSKVFHWKCLTSVSRCTLPFKWDTFKYDVNNYCHCTQDIVLMQAKENITYNKTAKHIKGFFLNLRYYTFDKKSSFCKEVSRVSPLKKNLWLKTWFIKFL